PAPAAAALAPPGPTTRHQHATAARDELRRGRLAQPGAAPGHERALPGQQVGGEDLREGHRAREPTGGLAERLAFRAGAWMTRLLQWTRPRSPPSCATRATSSSPTGCAPTAP